MDVRRVRAPLGLALLGGMVLGACGGDAQSAGDDESTPIPAPSQEGPAPELPAADEAPAAEPEPSRAQPGAPAPRPAAPAQQPERERVIPVGGGGSYATPVEPRPDAERTIPGAEPRAALRTIAAGRALELNVEAQISTEASKAGDVFYATLSDDVLGNGGEVLLPVGTRLKGRVVESRESQGPNDPPVLTLEFESVTVNGAVRPLRASVVDVEMKAETRDSNTATAAKVGAGAAVGAIAGRILGRDRQSTAQGAVVGAVAGTAAAVATRDGHATIRPGARIVIRLDEALAVDG